MQMLSSIHDLKGTDTVSMQVSLLGHGMVNLSTHTLCKPLQSHALMFCDVLCLKKVTAAERGI